MMRMRKDWIERGLGTMNNAKAKSEFGVGRVDWLFLTILYREIAAG